MCLYTKALIMKGVLPSSMSNSEEGIHTLLSSTEGVWHEGSDTFNAQSPDTWEEKLEVEAMDSTSDLEIEDCGYLKKKLKKERKEKL